MSSEFSFVSFLARWLFAAVLVAGTYNPTQYCYVSWVLSESASFGPIIALTGVALAIGWIIFLRATLESMGLLGIVLGGALFACLIWLFIDMGWLSVDSPTKLTWVILLVLSLILASGMSWSHIRRRLTGQVDVDERDV
jgi:Na+/melibiose symporter-like transporter